MQSIKINSSGAKQFMYMQSLCGKLPPSPKLLDYF